MVSRTVTRNQDEQGLTLLELAVVVAIIGVLTALLLPALASARERARPTACARNLSTLYRGVAAYRNDFGEYYPTGRTRTGGDDPERRYWWGGYHCVGNMPWPVDRKLGTIHGYLCAVGRKGTGDLEGAASSPRGQSCPSVHQSVVHRPPVRPCGDGGDRREGGAREEDLRVR